MTKQETLRPLADLSGLINASRGEPLPYQQVFDVVGKLVPFTEAFITTTLPRGWLQIVQPKAVSETLIKGYLKGFHLEDGLTWGAILQQRPVRATDQVAGRYLTEFLVPNGLRFGAAVPLEAPVLSGYPGALHLYRAQEQGDFTNDELDTLANLARKLDSAIGENRGARERSCGPRRSLTPRPVESVIVLDANGRELGAEPVLPHLDERLCDQLLEFARKRVANPPAHPEGERVQFPDSKGDLWTFRGVAYQSYPAIGDGSYVVISIMPSCCAWSGLRPSDFEADPELSRLIPALQFMQTEFHRSPTLGEIAKTVHLSPFHFHRRFAELLGLTPKHFLLECQIHAAKQQLLARQKELSEIATDCGFAHQSHFTSRFKQATGLTPTRWRRLASEVQSGK